MKFLRIVEDFCDVREQEGEEEVAEKALFEAAMLDKLRCETMRVADLMWEIYVLQREVSKLKAKKK